MSAAHRNQAGRQRRAAARWLTAAGCAALLAGCVTTGDRPANPSYPMDVRQRHPIAIREGVHTVELFVGRRGELTLDQRADVLAFAHTWRREAAGGVVIEQPTGTSNEAAAAGALQEVRAILVNMGVPPQGIEVRPYRPEDPRTLATLRLNYPRTVASAGPCGMWPHDIGPTADREHAENLEYWNFGCASQRNLAAQVANAADLVQPRGETASYTPRRTFMVEKYRRGEDPAMQIYTTNQSKIADIGKQ